VDELLRLQARAARAEIQSGALRGAALRDRLVSVPYLERDGFVDELLGIEPPPPDSPELPRGAVPYLPSEVEDILATVRDVPLGAEDTFVDLGSGLGRVVLLAHLLSGARGVGVEIQEHLVRMATARATELRLPAVSFVHGSAEDVELEGSVFFLYAPFSGDMLARVVRKIEAVARKRPIVLCAVALELRDVPWLMARESSSVSLTLYDSRVAP
jgi:SAM-dependent methyltransferase